MVIKLATGIGSGPTELSAFDSALNHAGVANYNLIRLSSVIPPETTISVQDHALEDLPGGWGDRLYVVMAEQRESTPNREAWAGIGWVQDQETGRGLFVEHEGESERTVREDISDSLHALMATRNVNFGEIQMKVVGAMCHRDPICAMAVAVYQASDWENGFFLI
jgi:arginine decarboxylase